MAQHLILLTQASAWHLGKQEEVRIFYLAYAGTVSHDKLKQLASQGGAAALFKCCVTVDIAVLMDRSAPPHSRP